MQLLLSYYVSALCKAQSRKSEICEQILLCAQSCPRENHRYQDV